MPHMNMYRIAQSASRTLLLFYNNNEIRGQWLYGFTYANADVRLIAVRALLSQIKQSANDIIRGGPDGCDTLILQCV